VAERAIFSLFEYKSTGDCLNLSVASSMLFHCATIMTLSLFLVLCYQPTLFSAVLYQSIYVCLSTDFCHCKASGNHLTIAYGQATDVRSIFPSALCVSLICLSVIMYPPGVKIQGPVQHQPKRLWTCYLQLLA